MPLAIMLSKRFLGDRGAVRVHGGGFAGTIQVFIKNEYADEFVTLMNSVFGEGAAMMLKIRPVGACRLF